MANIPNYPQRKFLMDQLVWSIRQKIRGDKLAAKKRQNTASKYKNLAKFHVDCHTRNDFALCTAFFKPSNTVLKSQETKKSKQLVNGINNMPQCIWWCEAISDALHRISLYISLSIFNSGVSFFINIECKIIFLAALHQ